MELVLKRDKNKSTELSTIGQLYIDNIYFCDTLEDTDRGLISTMSLEEISKIKIKGITAIPKGKYKITLDIVSPRFSTKSAYKSIEGKLPRLLNVPGYEGILIHIGNYPKDTDGCILVGKYSSKDMISSSTIWFNKLYEKLKESKDDIYITIE